ncbi:fungal-specific transcription factor domain-containing protein [Mariannaea sp. PMI_226]|nr:fungal-specific transcription factor domain-containing protein [Mariannaea sp. PMI_226]
MASVLATQPNDVKPILPISPVSSGVLGTNQNPSPIDNMQAQARARQQRSHSPGDDGEGDGKEDNHDGPNGASSNSDGNGPTRKRRRSRKGLDKRFECNADGCGKSYSRAEHLYRHQLNHNSKQTYRCSFPNCPRTFVRGDLLKRHMDRHAAKGSQLNQRDSMAGHITPVLGPTTSAPEYNHNAMDFSKPHPSPIQYQQPQEQTGNVPYSPINNSPMNMFPNGGMHGMSNRMDMDSSQHQGYNNQAPQISQPHSPAITQRSTMPNNSAPFGVMSPITTQQGFSKPQNTMPQTSFVPQQNVMPINLPPSQFSNGHNSNSQENSQAYDIGTTAEYSQPETPQARELMMLDQMAMPGTVPVFGGDGDLNKSPYVGMPEDFMAYLFNSPQANMTPVIPPQYATYSDLQNSQFNMALLGGDASASYFPTAPQTVMAVNNLLEQQVPEATISEEKSQELFDFVKERFHDNKHNPVDREWDGMLDGDRSHGDHMLSKRMMQAYIGSYWYHFSDQMPILHKPTFSPDKTPNLLLLAMMAIGSACLDRTHGHKVTKAGAQLSNFLAWHLRWDIFMDLNFRPPAKLWVFQALILLELYEKMYSSRELHERAHIHHATTITLMRRGRSLIGKSALESPPNLRDGSNGSRQSSTSSVAPTAEKWWEHWVTNEATRRAAFAAFVIDSIHATMFGHSAVMVAHEMRLPLPCDDSMWRAGSSGEVWRIESNLMSNGIKPMSFLEGLKRTLSGQEVHTNSFGRTVLMAGLLSVSWHMHQRDLQVNVLGGGIIQALGGRDRWRATLTRAYDTWKVDFDKALERSEPSSDPYRDDATKMNEFNVVFESRTVLHHLAHMAMHADIVDCQMFARAKRLLGRAIGPQEFSSAQRRIKDHWAHSARARDATFYALKFLCSVLAPDQVTPAHAGGYHLDEPYDARDDVLLNRPWVLYFAALIVWSYGFALEGPCPNAPQPKTREEKLRYMREYFSRFDTLENPGNLQGKKGINQNTALLVILKDTFETTRWELLHEASNLLSNCIVLNAGGTIH